MNQRKASRAYYLFEEVLEEMPGFEALRKPRSLAELQLLAGLAWTREGGRGPCPIVRSRVGKYSQYEYPAKRGAPGVVGLVRKHRDLGSLLHEIAHGLGVNDKLRHGPAFRARCLRLFRVYGDWDGTI